MMLWIFGAQDVEMAFIREMVVPGWAWRTFATDAAGLRVSSSNHYKAHMTQQLRELPQRVSVALVECDFANVPDGWAGGRHIFRFDHHRPGDAGYGKPPSTYWESSTIGQVWRFLNGEQPPPDLLKYVAAADHCLGAAYRGECPGIDPQEMENFRITSRSTNQRRPKEELLQDLERAKQALRRAPLMELPGGQVLRDMRGPVVPELPEAAMRVHEGYCSGPLMSPDGRTKWTVSGDKLQVEAWLRWAEQQGLVDLYGDPQRGFGGGYGAPEGWPVQVYERYAKVPPTMEEKIEKVLSTRV